MPRCYLLTVTVGSSLDQQSHNVTLFNLVEQVNVPPGTTPQAGSRVPLEIHAYLHVAPGELGQEFELRYALSDRTTGLESYSEPARHRAAVSRMRTRSVGLPFPSMLGHYDLRIDFRVPGTEEWSRDAAAWPIAFVTQETKPTITH